MKLKDFLLSYKKRNGLSHEALAKMIGVSRSTYYRWITSDDVHLQSETMQRLSRLLGCDLSALLSRQHNVKPLLGVTKAGYDLFAEQEFEDYIEVNERDADRGDYFLRVIGDSMEGAHIFDGDLVYVQRCESVPSGKIAIVMIADEVTIKKVVYKKDMLILEAANPRYEARFFTAQEVAEIPIRIIGRVRFVRTDFD